MIRVLKSAFAAERFAAAKEFITSFPVGTEVLILGANRDCVDDLVRDVSSDTGATFGLHRFGFNQLVTRLGIPVLAREGTAPLGNAGLKAIVARAIYDATKGNQLQYFSPVADHFGFVRAATSTITELRLADVSDFRQRELDSAGRDIAALLRTFEEGLLGAQVADRAAVLRAATRAVRSRETLVTLPSLLLDIQVHSVLECEFVCALAETSREVFIAFPAADLLTAKSLSGLPKHQEISPALPQNESGLARLRTYLFSDRTPPHRDLDQEVVFFSAPGQELECVEVVRRIIEEAKQGIPFDKMAVLLRSPEKYVGVLQSAFRRADIPGFFAKDNRRPDPSGRAFLALLACAAEGLSAHRFAEYLSFAQIPSLNYPRSSPQTDFAALPEDEAFGLDWQEIDITRGDMDEPESEADDSSRPELAGSLRTPWRWEEVLVEAAVIGGKDRWARRLNGLEKQFRLELEAMKSAEPDAAVLHAIEQKLLNLQHLSSFSLPIIDVLSALPLSAMWGQWILTLENIAVKALRRPERVLTVLADMNPMAMVGPVSLDEVRAVLHDRLASLQQGPAGSRYGRVFVGTHNQARGRSFEVVFAVGLAERMFPQKVREDPLLLDELRKHVSNQLLTQGERVQLERLQLQIAVGAARRRLYLSYPRVEIADARPRVPSSYVMDGVLAITGRVPDFEELAREAGRLSTTRLSWPAPADPKEAIDDEEFDLAVLRRLLNSPVDARTGGFVYLKNMNDHLLRSLRSRWLRWDKRWREYDGLCTKSPAVEKIIEKHRLTLRPYSTSTLEDFAVCPYRFFLSAVHRLRPKPERFALQQIDPLTRGHIFHKVQAAVLNRLSRAGLFPLISSNLPQAFDFLNDALDEIAAVYRDDLAPAIDRVWQDGIELMRADLRGWLSRLLDEPQWHPLHVEFAFGFEANANRDPDSHPEPVTLHTGHRIHGIADLVEESSDAQALRVTDHKTGLHDGRYGAVLGGGESLQPVLYSLAVERALNRPVIQGRLSFCTAAGGFSERIVPLDNAARERCSTLLNTIDLAFENVFLVPAPRTDACANCKFTQICGPYEEIRISLKEQQERLEPLRIIRRMK